MNQEKNLRNRPTETEYQDEQKNRGSGQLDSIDSYLRSDPVGYFHKKLSNNEFLREDFWSEAARRGESEYLIGLLQKTEDEKFSRGTYDVFSAYGDRMTYDDYMFALAEPHYDNTVKKPRVDEQTGYEFGDFTDREWAKEITKTTVGRWDAEIIETEQKNKNFFAQLKVQTAGGLTTLAGGVWQFVGDIYNVGEGLLNMIFNWSKDSEVGDRFTYAFGNDDTNLNPWGKVGELLTAASYELQRQHGTTVNAVEAYDQGYRLGEGNNFIEQIDNASQVGAGYTTWGRYLNTGAQAIGYMLPTIMLAYATGGSSAAATGLGANGLLKAASVGTRIAAGLNKARSLVFYTGIFSGMIKETVTTAKMNGINYRDLDSGEVIGNALVKSVAQYAVERALGMVLGFSGLDKMLGMGGKTVSRAGAKTIKGGLDAAGPVIMSGVKDALKEGTEETLQELSDFVVDYLYNGTYRDEAIKNFSIQNLVDSFVVGAASSLVMGTFNNIIVHTTDPAVGVAENGELFKLGFFEHMNLVQSIETMKGWEDTINSSKASIDKKASAILSMNAAMQTLGDIYTNIGTERAIKSDALIADMLANKVTTDKIAKFTSAGNYTQSLWNDFQEAQAEASAKYVSIKTAKKIMDALTKKADKLKKAKVTKTENVITETIDTNNPNITINKEAQEKLKAALSKFGVEAIVSVNGDIVTKSEEILIVNEKLVQAGDIEDILKGVAYDLAVDTVIHNLNDSQKGLLDKTYTKFVNEKGTLEDAVTALLFDKYFYTYVLLASAEGKKVYGRKAFEMLATIDQLITAEATPNITNGTLTDKAYKVLLAKIQKTMQTGLVTFATQYQYIDTGIISNEILSLELKDEINNHRNVVYTKMINEGIKDKTKGIISSDRIKEFDKAIDKYGTTLFPEEVKALKNAVRSINYNDRVDAYTVLTHLVKTSNTSDKLIYLPSNASNAYNDIIIKQVETEFGVDWDSLIKGNYNSNSLTPSMRDFIQTNGYKMEDQRQRLAVVREVLFNRSNKTLTIGLDGTIMKVLDKRALIKEEYLGREGQKKLIKIIKDSSDVINPDTGEIIKMGNPTTLQDICKVKLDERVGKLRLIVDSQANSDTSGYYMNGSNNIQINLPASTDILDTIMHEATHATQYILAIGPDTILGGSASFFNILPSTVQESLNKYLKTNFPLTYKYLKAPNITSSQILYFMLAGELQANASISSLMFEVGFTWKSDGKKTTDINGEIRLDTKAILVSPDGKMEWSMEPSKRKVNATAKISKEIAKKVGELKTIAKELEPVKHYQGKHVEGKPVGNINEDNKLPSNKVLNNTWGGDFDSLDGYEFEEAIRIVNFTVYHELKKIYGDRVKFNAEGDPFVEAERRGNMAVLYHGTEQADLSEETYKQFRDKETISYSLKKYNEYPTIGDVIFVSTVPEYSLSYGPYLYEILLPYKEYQQLSNAKVEPEFDAENGVNEEVWRATEHAVQRVIDNINNSIPQFKSIKVTEDMTSKNKLVRKLSDRTGFDWTKALKHRSGNPYINEDVELHKFYKGISPELLDEQGNLKTLYHGSKTSGFSEFKGDGSDNSVGYDYKGRSVNFFTDNRSLAAGYARGLNGEARIDDAKIGETRKGVYNVHLNIKNPYIIDVKGGRWTKIIDTNRKSDVPTEVLEATKELMPHLTGTIIMNYNIEFVQDYVKKLGYDLRLKPGSAVIYKFTKKVDKNTVDLGEIDVYDITQIVSKIAEDKGWNDFKPKKQVFDKLTESTDQLVSRILDENDKNNNKYDGVIFKNVDDSLNSLGKIVSNVYVTFNANQIKEITNTNPTESPHINEDSFLEPDNRVKADWAKWKKDMGDYDLDKVIQSGPTGSYRGFVLPDGSTVMRPEDKNNKELTHADLINKLPLMSRLKTLGPILEFIYEKPNGHNNLRLTDKMTSAQKTALRKIIPSIADTGKSLNVDRYNELDTSRYGGKWDYVMAGVGDTYDSIIKKLNSKKNGSTLADFLGDFNADEIIERRFINNKEANKSNMKYWIDTKEKGHIIQVDPRIRDFVVGTTEGFDKLPDKLKDKIYDGKLTIYDINNFVATSGNTNDFTFKAIAKYIYRNSVIADMTSKDMKLLFSKLQEIAALSGVVDNPNEQMTVKEMIKLVDTVNDQAQIDSELEKKLLKFTKIARTCKVTDKNGNEAYIETDADILQLNPVFFNHYNGTINSVYSINKIGQTITANQKEMSLIENVETGEAVTEGSSEKKPYNWIDKKKTAETQYTYGSDVEAVLDGIDRLTKIQAIENAFTEEKLRNNKEKLEKKMATMTDKEKNIYVKKVQEELGRKLEALGLDAMSDEELNQKYLDTVVGQIKPSDDRHVEGPVVISKNAPRSIKNIKDHLRQTAAKVTDRISTDGRKNKRRYNILSDLAKENIDPTTFRLNDNYKTMTNAQLEVLLEEMKRSAKNLQDMIKSDEAKKREKQLEQEHLRKKVEKEMKAKEKTKEKTTMREKVDVVHRTKIIDQTFAFESRESITETAKELLDTQWGETTRSKVKVNGLTTGKEQNVHNGKVFFEQNAKALMTMDTQQAENTVKWFMDANMTGAPADGPEAQTFAAVRLYLLGHVFSQAKPGGQFADFNINLKQRLETFLRSEATVAGTSLAVWNNIQGLINPYESMKNADMVLAGVVVSDTEKTDLMNAAIAGDMAAIDRVRKQIIDRVNKEKTAKKGIFDILRKITTLRSMSMLSSPLTWLRNPVSNMFLKRLNRWSSKIGGAIASNKTSQGQFKMDGQITPKIQDFINKEFLDNGMFNTLITNLSKYNPSDIQARFKDATGRASKEAIFHTMVIKSLYNEFYNQNMFNTPALNKVHKFLMKTLSDNNYVREAAIRYFGKIIAERGYTLDKGVTDAIMNDFATSIGIAMADYMHSDNIFSEIENVLVNKSEGLLFVYKLMLPFAKSQWNWFKAAMRYSPVGLGQSIYKLATLEKQIIKAEAEWSAGKGQVSPEMTEFLIRRNLGSGIIGTTSLIFGMILAALGYVDLEDDDYGTPKLRIGNLRLDISTLFGTSSVLAGMALIKTLQKDGSTFKDGIDAMLDPLLNGFFLTQILEMDKYSQGGFGSFGLNFFEQTLLSFIPNGLRWASGAFYTGKYKTNNMYERAVARIPFLGSIFKLNKYTNPYAGDQGNMWDIFNRVMPYLEVRQISAIESNSKQLGINKEQLRGSYEINSEKFELSAKDTAELNKIYGEWNASTLTSFYNNQNSYSVQMPDGSYKTLTYNQMTVEQQRNVVQNIFNKNAEYAKISAWLKAGNTYYANANDYATLRKLGITGKIYRGTKGFVKS